MKNHSRPILAWCILCLSFFLLSGCLPEDPNVEDPYAEDPHADLSYQDYPANCLECHTDQASEVHASTHYQWLGEAPDMTNGSFILQGKLTNAVNSYCINIEGNWPVCGTCHVGRGKRPDDPNVGYENIDCLMCHNQEYASSRTRLADGSMGVVAPTDSMVQNIHEPTRANCLACHAKAGGGDGVKRGDLSLALIDNSDQHFDTHMNSEQGNLNCQDCHTFENHLVIGKGSDLRPTDDPDRGSEVACTTCHSHNDIEREHPNEVLTHFDRVACQTCHIPTYAKVPTELHRDWLTHHDGTDATTCTTENPCPGHPHTEKGSDLIPEYKWWNRLSDNYLLQDDAARTYDAAKDTYPTSRPLGDVTDGKLYPFKYKTAYQPMTVADSRLIAMDTFEYLKKSGNVLTSVENGLENMGYPRDTAYNWITTDTYQLINHGVVDAVAVLACNDCHGNTGRMDLQGKLGYELKGDMTSVCTQCHESQKVNEFMQEPGKYAFDKVHDKHVSGEAYDCSACHNFSRPERNLRLPQ